ncbi:MAG: endonuclease/exonuclease/phosphatase family protein [Limisphaerales bacterium]
MSLFRPAFTLALLAALGLPLSASAQVSNLAVRVVAANLTSGNSQSYETPGINILKGLKPDVVAMNEFRYNNSTNDSQARALVDLAFGTNFHFFKEVAAGYSIPNGIVSRWPILEAGTWNDTQVPDRGFAWARIDLPGTNDLYVVSVHLHAAGGPSSRAIEATNLKALIQTHFPANAWLIVAGDFNTDSRSESAMATFKTFLSDDAVPVDQAGDPDTNAGRNKPYDYVLPSFSLTNFLTPVVIGINSFPAGLVFDSRVYTPLSDVPPVVSSDSDALNMQHMAVVKNFLLPVWETNPPPSAPVILVQPQSQTNQVGATAQFVVAAAGTAPLAYQWRFFGTNLPGATATNLVRAGLTTNDAGPYTVVVTNVAGAVTSSVAVLTIVGPATNSYTGILAGWDVSGLTNFGPSPLPPTTNASGVGVTGLTRGAGVTTVPTAASRAWGGNGFNAASATDAVASNDFVSVTLSAPPGHRLSLSAISRFDYRRSSTGPTNGLLQFAVGDSSFADLTSLAFPSTLGSGASLGTVDLSGVAALQAVPAGTNVTLRLVLFGGTSASGTWYVFDTLNNPNLDFVIEGALTPVNPPGSALPPVLVQPVFTNGAFQFTLTGTTGAVYAVQATTNAAVGPWLGRATNAAPFVFTETNEPAVPARFYRGVLSP